MSNTTRYTGTTLYVSFGGTVLTGDQRAFSVEETAGEINATAGADASETFLPGFISRSATMNLLDATDGTANWNSLQPASSGTLLWAPQGTATGKPKFQALSKLMGRTRAFPYDDVVTIDYSFRVNADPGTAVY